MQYCACAYVFFYFFIKFSGLIQIYKLFLWIYEEIFPTL